MVNALRRELLRGAFLLAAAGASLAVRAEGEPASGGTLRVTADPPRLLLGHDAGAELRVTAPPDVEDLSLTASVGRIEGLRRVPGSGFAARFRPPAERFPQVAIVAAVGRGRRGTEQGFVAIPLSGQGDARVPAAPGKPVTLEIGERTFGPHTAGRDGIALVPVVVPPGIREAHEGFRPIDLRIPDSPLLHAVLDRSVVLADREEQVRAWAYVVAPHGAARRGDVPSWEPSRGTVSAVERVPGLFEITWTLPPGRAGEERLAVRLPASPASRAALKVEAVAGPPAVVAVAFDRAAIVAGAPEPARVVARVLDAAGNPVPAEIRVATDAGSLEDVTARPGGEVEARLAVGPSFGGRSQVVVTASAPALGISGSRALALRSAEAAVARFASGRGVLRTDGSREFQLRLSVEDPYGNPVATSPRVSAERGRVVAVAAEGAGSWVVRYVPPSVGAPVDERLVAEVGTVRAGAERLLAPPGPTFAVSPSAGMMLDVRGRFAAPAAAISAEGAADLAVAVRRDLDLAWRGQVRLLGLPAGLGTALLAGGSARRSLPWAGLRAGVLGGALFAAGGGAPAVELSAVLERQRPGRVAFLELSLLAAGRGAPGSFAALTLSGGFRIGPESLHANDPDRR